MILIPMVTGTAVVFWICAVLAILGAVGLVTFHKPVYCALCLALVMISLAVIYASLGAPFLFAVQIIVYTGAVLMLFLFVIMLVGVSGEDSFSATLKGHGVAVGFAGVGILVLLTLAVAQGIIGSPIGLGEANSDGNVQGLADLIFSKYVIAFESTAALLITAAVAAMVLAHPEQVKKKVGQAERAAQRLEAYATAGADPGPRPNSGVFARHNSIATPALLPDGSVALDSVSQVLAERVALESPEELWAPHDEVLAAIEEADPELEDEEVEDAADDVGITEDVADDVGMAGNAADDVILPQAGSPEPDRGPDFVRMTKEDARMTREDVRMTEEDAGTAGEDAGMTEDNDEGEEKGDD